MLARRSFALLGRLSVSGVGRLGKTTPILSKPRLSYSVFIRGMAYSVRESGSPYSKDYRVYFKNADGNAISPFHDIPLFANKEKTIVNMVVEIPRWTNAKMEINTKEALNPIKQDVKKDKVRFVNHCFPYHGYIWNYGALPQTWEDPSHKDEGTGCLGDNDPIDACEIGTMVSMRGEVKQVKVLGILAMIDEGETDWKVICIDVNDPAAKHMNDIGDVEKHMPGLIKATVDWFKIYKIPAGKPENKFAYEAEAKNKEFAMKIVNETHTYWRQLVMKETENIQGLACKNVKVSDSPYHMSQEDADAIINNAPPLAEAKDINSDMHCWHYVQRS